MNEVQMQQKLEEYFNTHEDANRTYEQRLQYLESLCPEALAEEKGANTQLHKAYLAMCILQQKEDSISEFEMPSDVAPSQEEQYPISEISVYYIRDYVKKQCDVELYDNYLKKQAAKLDDAIKLRYNAVDVEHQGFLATLIQLKDYDKLREFKTYDNVPRYTVTIDTCSLSGHPTMPAMLTIRFEESMYRINIRDLWDEDNFHFDIQVYEGTHIKFDVAEFGSRFNMQYNGTRYKGNPGSYFKVIGDGHLDVYFDGYLYDSKILYDGGLQRFCGVQPVQDPPVEGTNITANLTLTGDYLHHDPTPFIGWNGCIGNALTTFDKKYKEFVTAHGFALNTKRFQTGPNTYSVPMCVPDKEVITLMAIQNAARCRIEYMADGKQINEDYLQYYVSEGAVLDIEMEVSPTNDVKCTVNTKGCRRRKMMPHLFGR